GGATGQSLHSLVGAAHPDVKRDIRILYVKSMEHRRNEAFDRGLEAINVDRSGLKVLQRRDIFEHAWEKPAKALLDYFELDAVDWLGARTCASASSSLTSARVPFGSLLGVPGSRPPRRSPGFDPPLGIGYFFRP